VAANSEGEGRIRQGRPIVPPFSRTNLGSVRPLFRPSTPLTGRMTQPPFSAHRAVEAPVEAHIEAHIEAPSPPEQREILARAVTEPMLAAIEEPSEWFDAPVAAVPETRIESAETEPRDEQADEQADKQADDPAAEWAVEVEDRDLLYGLRSDRPSAIDAIVSLDEPQVVDRRPEWAGPTPLSVTAITATHIYRPSIESALAFDSVTPMESLPPVAAPPAATPATPAAAQMPTPVAFRSIPDIGASTRRIAEALETVAARVRRGELQVIGTVPEGDERAAIAAVLAALLGVAPA
jgi:hypothetical protein